MKHNIKIPRDRIHVINSADQKFRVELENKLGVKLDFFQNTVEIEGEGLDLLKGMSIIKAIGRGFSPIRAKSLLNEEIELEIIELDGYSEKRANIIKSRVIGENGKCRRLIELYTKAFVSVYGKTISIIGDWEHRKYAKEAIKMILGGASHNSVYRFLEKLEN